MLGNANGNIVGYNVKNRLDVYFYILKNWFAQNLTTYNLLSDLKHGRNGKNRETCSVDTNFANGNVTYAAKHYASQISFAKSFAKSQGADFYHFLQPTLFDVDNLNEYEKKVLSHDPCWSIAKDFKEEYDKQFLEVSPHTIDLSETFNNKSFFFDYIHVSAKGNKSIVEHMLKKITIN